jgi:hypothetical protein
LKRVLVRARLPANQRSALGFSKFNDLESADPNFLPIEPFIEPFKNNHAMRWNKKLTKITET